MYFFIDIPKAICYPPLNPAKEDTHGRQNSRISPKSPRIIAIIPTPDGQTTKNPQTHKGKIQKERGYV